MSPTDVIGESALNALAFVVCPVPPFVIATVPVTFAAVPVVLFPIAPVIAVGTPFAAK